MFLEPLTPAYSSWDLEVKTMMRYQHNHSTFIPKEKPASGPDTYTEKDLDPSKEESTSQFREYNNKIKEYDNKIEKYYNRIRELEAQLEFKDAEIHSFSDTVFSLEEEINRLRDAQNTVNASTDIVIDTAEIDRLNIELNYFREENAKLGKEIASQNEHTQLLYVLIIILSIL
jgi:chromosome segregation ATPase